MLYQAIHRADLAVICVAKDNENSYINAKELWLNVVRDHAPDALISLILTKNDTEENKVSLDDLHGLK